MGKRIMAIGEYVMDYGYYLAKKRRKMDQREMCCPFIFMISLPICIESSFKSFITVHPLEKHDHSKNKPQTQDGLYKFFGEPEQHGLV